MKNGFYNKEGTAYAYSIRSKILKMRVHGYHRLTQSYGSTIILDNIWPLITFQTDADHTSSSLQRPSAIAAFTSQRAVLLLSSLRL